MKVLHFLFHGDLNCRCQRALQACINLGYDVVLFVNREVQGSLWIPDALNVAVEGYGTDWRWFYAVEPGEDYLGLREAFYSHGCNVVHAHELWTAVYAYRLGLPVVFDDWEFWLQYQKYARHGNDFLSCFAHRLKSRKSFDRVLELLRNIPVVVTNKNVAEKYIECGARFVRVVPNVPLKFERKYAFSGPVKKCVFPLMCYIGDLSREDWCLRDAREINAKLVYEFKGKNRVSHLNVLRKLRSFEFNLLYWKPFKFHRFYLQNKAFLASAVGVPTIISSSLEATIGLLGNFAIPVSSVDQITNILKEYEPRDLQPYDDQFLEYYLTNFKELYREGVK